MTYIPFTPENGAKYNLIGPDGVSIASFNDPTDPNYCGLLTDVTGLDSPDVRESGDVLVGTDGGWHGNFYYGRRPITLTGSVVNVPDTTTRAARLDTIRRVSNAMRLDGTLWWQPTSTGSIPMQTYVRLQQPFRTSGAWVKTFQLQLVSQWAPLFSASQYTIGSNEVANPDFELDANGAAPASWNTSALGYGQGAAGATATATTAQFYSGTKSMQIVTTNAAAMEGVWQSISGPFIAGQNYNISVMMKGNAGGENVYMLIGNGASHNQSASINLTTGWANYQLNWTPASTVQSAYFSIYTGAASAYTWFVDNVQVAAGPSTGLVYGGKMGLIAENHGSWASLPLVTIYGPTSGTQVVVTNTTTGQVFQTTAGSGFSLAAGASVTVDMLNHIMYSGSTYYNSYIDFTNTTWPALIPGSPAAAGLNTFTLSGATAMSVIYRDNWI